MTAMQNREAQRMHQRKPEAGDYLDLLEKNLLFKGFHKEELEQFLTCHGGHIKSYEKGHTIGSEGEPIEGVGIVLAGAVSVSKDNPQGERLIMARLHEGDVFGEVAVYTGTIWTATVMSKVPSIVLFLKREKLLDQGEPCEGCVKFQLNMLQLVAKKALSLNVKLEILAMRTLRKKVLKYLLLEWKKTKENPLDLPFNREDMAEFLQVARPALSRELSLLKEEGLIHYKGKRFILMDVERIQQELSS